MKKFSLVVMLLLLTAQVASARQWYTARPKPKQTKPTPTETAVVLTPAESAARDVLNRMEDRLNHSEGVQFNASITFPTGNAANIVTKTITSSTTLERTAKLMIVVTEDNGQAAGTLAATGTNFTLYDAPSGKYTSVVTSSDLWSLEQALELAGKDIYPKQSESARDLRAAIEFPMVYFDGFTNQKFVEVGETLSYQSSSTTNPDGRTVTLVTETLSSAKIGTIAASYMIDPATNLPAQFSQIETRPGKKPVFDLQETFTNFKTIRTPLPQSTYSYTPPTGSIMVQ